MKKINDALKMLEEHMKKDGKKGAKNQNREIYKKEFFEGLTPDEEKHQRGKLRKNMLHYLVDLAGVTNKEEFKKEFSLFSDFYKLIFVSQNPLDFSVFDNLSSENNIKLVENAKKVIEKYNK